jgi:2-keto-4-pentenoate hydratase/2-oxohepta-3-ene-1,7-dioic acid hydratase in catechol pathway
MIFNKQSTSAHPPYDPFHLPRASAALDYEGELAVVIGKRCRHVPRERAHEVVAGYTICNDVSVRDWQLRVPTFTMGKSFDTHCPLGPALVTADEIPDPHSLELHTWVNGEPRQSSNTKHLIFDCFTLIEHLSTAFTLEPGDVISTGTPGGVGIAQKPPALLKAGDVVKIAIDGLGEIENSVIDEPASTVQIG